MRLWPAVAAVSLLPRAAGLYEDEVGQYEWALQQIGKPVAFAYSAEASDRIFVASASGTVASVLLKDGTMQWRRIASTEGGVRQLRASSRGLVTATDSGIVQTWKGSTGDLVWQREYGEPVLELLVVGAQTQNVIVVRKGEIECRSMGGKSEWALSVAQAGLEGELWAAATSPEDSDSVCIIAAQADGSSPVSRMIQVAEHKVTPRPDLPKAIGTALRRGSFILVDSHIVGLVKGQIIAAPVCGGKESTFDLPSADFKLSKWQRTPGVFSVTNGVVTLVFGLDDTGVKRLRQFEGIAVVGPIISAHEDEPGQPVAVALTKEDGAQLQLMDPASGNVQPAMIVKGYSSADHGPAELLLMHELKSGEHRTIISAADHSFAGIQGEKVMWVREEALASINQAVFYSREAAATVTERLQHAGAEAPSEGLPALVAQLTSLPGRLAELSKEPAALVAAFAAWVTPKRMRRTRELNLAPGALVPTSSEELRAFGADKLVIAITSSNKLFALEATSSEIVWHKYLGASGGCADVKQCSPSMRLLPSDASPVSELLLLLPSATGHRVLWVDPLSGAIKRQESLPAGTPRVNSLLPLMHHHSTEDLGTGSQPFLLIDEQRRVHLLPSGSEKPKQLLHEQEGRLFHFEVDRSTQAVQGFSVKKSGLTPLWNIELGGNGERVVASAVPDHREWAHVPVYIKGDSTILFKYINKNMLAVATEDTSRPGNTTALNLYVLDAVTGHILHQSNVPGGARPVHLVACDNWVVMHYQNPVRTRFEVAVVELFQAKADDGPWDIIFGSSKPNQTQSAHHLETPVPLQQTYVFPVGVTAMGVTATNKGITPRSIIMALTTEHLWRVSKDMVNPRRPYPQTGSSAAPAGGSKAAGQFAPTKEEMVPPYSAVLPLKAHDILTHHHPTTQVRGIISSPSGLESTSLVFAYGLDLFFTPVQSAKAYDVLSPGFNYVMLYLSVSLVVALWVSTSWLASRKALQDRWK